jgi:hypothetical protein
MAQVAKRLIDAHRSENGFRNLFGDRLGTVSVTTFNGENIFGSNSTSPTYTAEDRRAAISLRSRLIENYPDVMRTDNVGQRPNDAIFLQRLQSCSEQHDQMAVR